MSVIINVEKIYTPTRVVSRGSIRVVGGRVVDIKPYWRGGGSIEARDLIAVPGFIDTHVHGYAGHDVNSGSRDEILGLSRRLLETGVTSYLPTTVSLRHERLLRVAEVVGDLVVESPIEKRSSRILGLYLEGPYINTEMRGAQNPEAIRRPSLSEIEEYIKASERSIRVVALAPEIPGVMELIPVLVERGVIVSIGHTNATYEEALEAFRLGASRVTHVFNAMRRFHHRDPGPVLAALEDTRVYVEFIGDLVHISPPVLRFLLRTVGRRGVGVTDAISAAGLPDGDYELGGLRVVVREGVARLPDGTLAGSTLSMARALKNMVSIGIDLVDALYTLTEAPARSLGTDLLGCIRPGCIADIVLMNKNLDVCRVFLEGEEVFYREVCGS